MTFAVGVVDVLSEDAILKWYSDGKGKGVLLEQLKHFVEWLKHAEEGIRRFMLPLPVKYLRS